MIPKEAKMEATAVYDRLTSVFREVFDEDDLVVSPHMTADDVDGWDSLNHIRLMLAVSNAFGVKFTALEIGALKNVGELADLIIRKT
jgi:acyl carrier protein